MTLTEIRNAVIARMTAQTAIASDAVDYPNGPVFDPSGRNIWARFTNVPGLAGANEIGAGPVVQRTGVLI
ncbi:electron transfer flavoprotein subunit beta, partial [Salmonella enterica subsp. enterica serovar Reading]|nr:electron transfer flavoprotein subunit beta [Salmonella enterica subsp. enterica serovar Reading]